MSRRSEKAATLADRRGRGGHAARPLVPPPLSRSAADASQQDRAQGRSPGRRQAGGDFDPARSRPERARAPAASPAARPKDAPAPPNPADAEALREMILFEDRDVIVLNKPYGLAVQGGSGTKRHIDGMLAALADKKGERPVLVHRLDRDTSGVLLVAKSRKIAADLGATFRSRGAKKIYWALVEGVPKPAQGRISMFLAKGEGMGEERGARGRPCRHRAHARRAPWRSRRAAFADALCRRSTRSRRGSPGSRCARSPGAPINCARIARRSAIPSSAIPNITAGPRTIPRAPIRCAPCRRASSRSCTCSRGG